ncbi:MAG: class I SAM-dependent methyltransferase [Acidimicrobiia bacterium]|nr:class I SAM-dependent methyltransferase [Acidimicrobiia bacterium]
MSESGLGREGGSRNQDEHRAVQINATTFDKCRDDTATKLANFPKYVRRQDLTKLFVRYELFKQILPVKGSIVECGVFRGAGTMTWARLSALLEPNNILRKVYGFDSFEGFPTVGDEDQSGHDAARVGELAANSHDELLALIEAFDMNRFLGHVPKVELIAGDATATIPAFVESNPHLVISLLYLDFDLYEPTKVALDTFLPRMPKGSLLVFDELDNAAWPGETLAAVEDGLLSRLELRRLDFDPYVAYAVL